MKLFLIRHGESTWNDKGIIQGNRDPYLSPKGNIQARQLARYLKSFKIEKIFSSNLRRACQTAEILGRRLNLPVIKMPQLQEIKLGLWQGKNLKQFNHEEKILYEKWVRSPSRTKVPGGEKVSVFDKRVRQAFNTIINSADGAENVAVVTHGGVICAYLSYVLKADIDRMLVSVRLDNAGITLVEVFQGKDYWVRTINYTAHLN